MYFMEIKPMTSEHNTVLYQISCGNNKKISSVQYWNFTRFFMPIHELHMKITLQSLTFKENIIDNVHWILRYVPFVQINSFAKQL